MSSKNRLLATLRMKNDTSDLDYPFFPLLITGALLLMLPLQAKFEGIVTG